LNIDSIDIVLKELESFSLIESQDMELHEVERGILDYVLKIGMLALKAHIQERGTGNRGQTINLSDGRILSYIEDKKRDYLSIFGKTAIYRAYYWKKGCGGGCHPLDKEMNLPEDQPSYLLQEWGYGGCTKDAYDRADEMLEQIFGIRRPKRSIQNGVLKVSKDVDSFHGEVLHQDNSPEGDVLALEADGKGVPMANKKTEENQETKTADQRLGRGEKRLKKKMAEIVTIQTIDSKKLKADREAGKKDTQALNKMAYGDLTNQDEFLEATRDIAKKRAEKSGIKKKVFLGDGQPCIWGIHKNYFSSYIPILDWYHMSEYLWKAAHLLFGEKGNKAEIWVKKKERQLFDGRVETVIRSTRRYAKTVTKKKKRKEIVKCANYFDKNKERMRYDRYINMGLPIGTGSVEGTCKHLVITRMEGCGMRWKEKGAQAILKLRSVYINHLWSDFWKYYRKKQSETLYPNIIPIHRQEAKELKQPA